jgi:hypothetical protein
MNNAIPITMHVFSTRILISKYFYLPKDPELHVETADSVVGTEKVEDEPGISCAIN